MLIKNNTKRIINVDGVKIMPGVNPLEAADWKKIAPRIKDKIEEGEIENMEEKIDDDFAEGLAGYKAHDAKKLVEETADEKLLLEWKSTEKRKKVVDAINKRLEYISNAVKEEEDEE